MTRNEAKDRVVEAARELLERHAASGYGAISHFRSLSEALALLDSTPDSEEGWRPIETAPKKLDAHARGPLIDLWVIDRRLTDCFWADEHWCQLERYGQGPSSVKGSPTYWKPVPAPPLQEPS